MDRPPDHYAVLGVAVDSDAETLRDAYRAKLRITHPDTAETAADAAMFSEVVDAGDVLLDPERRRAYNEQVARFWSEHTERARSQRVEQTVPSSRRFDPSFLVLGALVAIVGAAVLLWFPNRGTESSASVSTAGNEVVAVGTETAEAVVVAAEEPTTEPTAVPTPPPTTEAVTPSAAAPADASSEAGVDEGTEATEDQDDGEDQGEDQGEDEVSADDDEGASMARTERPATATSTDSDDAGDALVTDSAELAAADDLPALADLPTRGAIFRAPTLYLQGPVPSQEAMEQAVAVASAVVGPENVVNDYVVHPDAPVAFDGNVRIEQAVQFSPGSATILPEFDATLSIGYVVMEQNPRVTAIIEGHTDDVGSSVANLALSERRAIAVVDWLVGRGIDRDRMIPVGFGEGDPIASNDTVEGRATNRRIEAQFLNLLTPPELMQDQAEEQTEADGEVTE